MFGHYFKVALRNLLKHKGVSLINILGLAIGLACAIVMLLFAVDELSFDRFHENTDRIYRVVTDLKIPEQPVRHGAVSSPTTGPAMLSDFPEIEAAVRFRPYLEGGSPGKSTVRYEPKGEQQFSQLFMWTDESFFDVFSFDLVQGNPETALTDPFSVLVTEETAEKLFGDGNALGEIVTVDGGFDISDYKVTGVLKNFPKNSSLRLDMIGSISSLDNMQDERVVMDDWFAIDFYTFVLLKEGTAPEQLEAAFPDFLAKYLGEQRKSFMEYYLQPITDIHLHSQRLFEFGQGGNIKYVYGVLVIAFFLLAIACINFMNLSTARSASRAKDVGMRKASGAYRSQLITQFLCESVFVALLALVVAVVLVELTLPAFNAFVGKELEFVTSGDPTVLLGVCILAVVVGLVAGTYPAFFLSAFQPALVLKGAMKGGIRNTVGRKLLVVFQFATSIMLMIGAWLVSDQIAFMRGQDLGWDREQLVAISMRDVELRQRYETFSDEVTRSPNISNATFSSIVIGHEAPKLATLPEGATTPAAIDTIIVDPGYVKTLGLEIVAGRDFIRRNESDANSAFIMNEAAVRHFDWGEPKDAIGKKLVWGAVKRGEVIGIVKDFHFEPLRSDIQPLVMHVRPIVFHYCYARIQGDIPAAIDYLEETWKKFSPGQPFDYFFVDDDFDALYRAEERIAEIFGTFAAITIFVACLGLFGLASFVTEQRTKEIGIRKVHGASIQTIVFLLSKEFVFLVLVANLIAWPATMLFMQKWLQGFATRIQISLLPFILSALVALLIAGLTVAYQSIKAARLSPVKALRYE